MNISVALPALAPQPTGHPASLPADPAVRAPERSVNPASGTAGSGAHDTAQNSEQSAAPPSAIQIKITEMLRQQAEELKHAAPADPGES